MGAVGAAVVASQTPAHAYSLPDLPYAFEALEPVRATTTTTRCCGAKRKILEEDKLI